MKPGTETDRHSQLVGLSTLIEQLRRDKEIRTQIGTFRRLLQREAVEKTDALEEQICGVICDTLKRLAVEYIPRQWSNGNAGVLLSYDSILRRARITDRTVHQVSVHPAEWTSNVTDVLLTEMEKLIEGPAHVEVHRLAMQRIAQSRDQVHTRVPLYLRVLSNGDEKDLEALKNLGIDFPEESGDYHFGTKNDQFVCTFALLHKGRREQDLKSLVRFIHSHSDPETEPQYRYPSDPEALRYPEYGRYIERLLLRAPGRPLWLSTVAVTDEISDLPLGSIMVFSEEPPRPELLNDVRDIGFELMNALWRVEYDVRVRRDEASALALWFAHEVKNIRKVIMKCQEDLAASPEGDFSQPPSLSTVSRRLDLLNSYAELMWKTVSSMTGDMSEHAQPEKFEEYLRSVPEVLSVPITLTFVCEKAVPLVYVFICMELIRNAIEQAIKHANGAVIARVRVKDGKVIFMVQSSPNEPGTAQQLRERYVQSDSAPGHLFGFGLRVIKRMASLLRSDCEVTWKTPKDKETSCTGIATLQF